MLKRWLGALLVVSVAAATSVARQAHAAVEEHSIDALQADLTAGRTTSEALVRAYLERIRRLDRAGPTLRALLALNPDALADARALDRERKARGPRGPLHGIPIVIKDNIESREPLATTAGSLALAANVTRRDAPLVANLRAAGAIVLGKTNLSEWANFRSEHSTSGWSAVGGLTRNPYVLDRSACGSSSGTGAAVAASLAAAGIGSETDGSITCPSALAGLVGLKPTLGLVSQQGIVPISHSQDTAGPMARSVKDVALLMDALTGRHDASALRSDALQGKRLGVLRYDDGQLPTVDAAYARALEQLKAAGATLVEVKSPWDERIGKAEDLVLHTEFKADLDAYLAAAPAGVKTRSLADAIAFNRDTPAELRWFGQEIFVKAQGMKGLDDPEYLAALELGRRLAGAEGLGRVMTENRLDALVAPTTGPAWTIDTLNGDHYGGSFTTMPAVAGYPHLTVPMGVVRELPVGLSFIGEQNSDARLLGYGYAFESIAKARRAPKFLATIDDVR
jgi:amidase